MRNVKIRRALVALAIAAGLAAGTAAAVATSPAGHAVASDWGD